MKRTEIIEKLIKEGFSEKTLVKFNDNQLMKFADKMLKEAQTVTTTKTVYNSKDPKDIAALNTVLKTPDALKDQSVEVKEVDGAKIPKRKKGKSILNLKDPSAFVENVVSKKYHSVTTKSEIMEMVKLKMSGTVSEELSERKMSKLPEFLSFDSIVSAGKPEESPAQPEVIPDTPTREKPKREDDPRRRPFRNPNEEPVPESDPKAKIKKLHRNKMSMAAE